METTSRSTVATIERLSRRKLILLAIKLTDFYDRLRGRVSSSPSRDLASIGLEKRDFTPERPVSHEQPSVGRPWHGVTNSTMGANDTYFVKWLQRERVGLKRDFPDSWSEILRGWEKSADLLVVVHIYHLDLLPRLADRIKKIDVPFDLVVTTNSDDLSPFHSSLTSSRLGRSAVLSVDNRGRDILPLVFLANFGLMDNYDFVLKVHGKKSPWRDDSPFEGSGDDWRETFLEALLPNEGLSHLVDLMSQAPQVGMITARGNLLKGDEFWGANRERTISLLKRIDLSPIKDRELIFPAGSMYLVRGFLLSGLRSLDLSLDDFENEEGQIDGTTSHAIERLIGALVVETGLWTVEV